MLKKSAVFFGIACAWALVGSAQAATTLDPLKSSIHQGNLTWQNIGEVSYTFADNNHDAVLDIGDTVTFSLTMEKSNWGTHRYDAMKVWLDDGAGHNLATQQFKWFYYQDAATPKTYKQIKDDGSYSYKAWPAGNEKVFSFSYTFKNAGTYDLLASVMCSRDLSRLDSAGKDDKPVGEDWNAWGENIHASKWLQGEDKTYQLTVAAVPEPGTYAMMIAGLGMLGAIARRRKQG